MEEKAVTLNAPYLGYRQGVHTGKRNGYHHIIRLPSGKEIELFEDEFTFD